MKLTQAKVDYFHTFEKKRFCIAKHNLKTNEKWGKHLQAI